MTQRLRTPSEDPDKRPLLERIEDDKELARALLEWVVPVLDLIEDPDLWARCSLLLGYTAGRLAYGPRLDGRAAIVAWLRAKYEQSGESVFVSLADGIERGEYLR